MIGDIDKLPKRGKLWNALAPRLSPELPGMHPFYAMNLFALEVFRDRLESVLNRDPLDFSSDELIAEYREFCRLRECVRSACSQDEIAKINAVLLDGDASNVGNYPKDFAEALRAIQKAMDAYRVRAHAAAIGFDVREKLFRIEKFRPFDAPLWGMVPSGYAQSANQGNYK